jgi:CheY-like chemotaxis protein
MDFSALLVNRSGVVVQIHSAAVSNRHPLLISDADVPRLSLAPADLRILIVNESMRSADSLKRTLRGLGYYTTLTAYSAKRALDAAADFSPSVALLDLELPDMTGFQLAHKLRSHLLSFVRRVPLLAVAESVVFGNRELARAAGFAGCLTKPVMPMELNGLLRRLHG